LIVLERRQEEKITKRKKKKPKPREEWLGPFLALDGRRGRHGGGKIWAHVQKRGGKRRTV